MRRPLAVVALSLLGSPLAAQASGGMQWKFANLQQGYCINFLVSPADAPGVLPSDAQPIRLDGMTDPPPVFLRVLQDQPEYASWMPAAVCSHT